MNSETVVRFAPSPNGALHLGHAFSALYTEANAREFGARLLLRIEDIDIVRSQARFIEGIFTDLAWLGLEWEHPVRRQSEHFGDYRVALDRLAAMGLVYPCFATRREIAAAVAGRPDHPRDPECAPVYPGLYRDLAEAEREHRVAAGEAFSLRLDMARAMAAASELAGGPIAFQEYESGPAGETGRIAVDPSIWGDVIIARKDVKTSYHLAVVVDDALQGVTHVTRGRDLFHTTHIHRLLQVLLGLPEPRYYHHRLIDDDTGRKLSKSAGDRSLAHLREAGVDAEEIRRELGFT